MKQYQRPILITCLAVWCIHGAILLLMCYYQHQPTLLPKHLPQELIEIISLPSQAPTNLPTPAPIPTAQPQFNPQDLPTFKPINLTPTIESELETQTGETKEIPSDHNQDHSNLNNSKIKAPSDQSSSQSEQIADPTNTSNRQSQTLSSLESNFNSSYYNTIQELSDHSSDQILAQRRKNKPTKPTFKFTPLNTYASATAEGNGIYSHQGTSNRLPTPTDFIFLDYQERVRKHFHQSFNAYANIKRIYIPAKTVAELAFILNITGEVIDIKTTNSTNNPTITKFMTKVLEYAGKFPPIPKALDLNTYQMSINITLTEGQISSGYNWH